MIDGAYGDDIGERVPTMVPRTPAKRGPGIRSATSRIKLRPFRSTERIEMGAEIPVADSIASSQMWRMTKMDAAPRKPPAILIVEDEAAPRMLTADFFQEAGYEALEAESGSAALRLLGQRSDIVAVVSDVQMPGETDGLELARKVREVSPYCPVVIISGRGTPSSADMPPRARYVMKPYRGEDLVQMVNEMLGREP